MWKVVSSHETRITFMPCKLALPGGSRFPRKRAGYTPRLAPIRLGRKTKLLIIAIAIVVSFSLPRPPPLLPLDSSNIDELYSTRDRELKWRFELNANENEKYLLSKLSIYPRELIENCSFSRFRDIYTRFEAKIFADKKRKKFLTSWKKEKKESDGDIF